MTNYEEKEEQQLIETIDDEGNVINFELIDIVDMDGQEYGLLLPIDDKKNDGSDEEKEAVLMRLTKEGEEYIFEMIENDEEFNKVVDYIDSLDEIEDDAE